jgi:hypothetical protein
MQTHNSESAASQQDGSAESRDQELQEQWRRVVERRSFLKGLAVTGAAGLPGSALLADNVFAADGQLSQRDVAILRLLAAIELIESDLWQQYSELAGVNGGK